MFRNLSTLGSLVLALLALVLWVRSYSHREWAFWADENHDDTRERCHNVLSLSGIVFYSFQTREVPTGSRCDTWAKGLHAYSEPVDAYRAEQAVLRNYYWKMAGFHFKHGSTQSPPSGNWELRTTSVSVAVPYWFVVSLCSAGPLIWSARWIRARRACKLRKCVVCGYDLRATPDRCPECGTAPKPPDNPPLHWTAAAERLL